MNSQHDQHTLRSNLVVLRGAVTVDPQSRSLPSGAVAVQFDLRTVIDDGGPTPTSVPVPVSWIDPPAGDAGLVVVGEELVVIGTVRRRFFRVGGATQSRTEVVAETVLPARRTKSVQSAITRAVGAVA